METPKYNTKAVVEAGLISALIVAISLINVYMPLFSMLGTFILPVPITLLYIRHGQKTTFIAVVVSGILIALLYSPLSALTSMIVYGSTGITLGYCIRNKKRYSVSILLLTAASALANLINLMIYVSLIQKGGMLAFFETTLNTLKKSFNMTNEIYSEIGIAGPQLDQMMKSLELLTPQFMMNLLPATLFIGAAIAAYINYNIAKMILAKLGYEIERPTPFTQVYVSSTLVAVLIIITCIGIVLGTRKISAGDMLITSSQIILQYIFIFNGVAAAIYFLMHRFQLSKGMTSIIVLFTLFSPMLSLYIFLGIADMIIDFRKVNPNRIRNR